MTECEAEKEKERKKKKNDISNSIIVIPAATPKTLTSGTWACRSPYAVVVRPCSKITKKNLLTNNRKKNLLTKKILEGS